MKAAQIVRKDILEHRISWQFSGRFPNYELPPLAYILCKHIFQGTRKIDSEKREKVCQIKVPLIRSPPTSPQTLYTALCLAQKINVSVVGMHRRRVITLDLDLYERAVKIRGNTGHTNCWVLRMGELHIMFVLLRSLGRYIEGSGLDDIWIEKGLYRSTVIQQMFCGKHLNPGVETHLVNLLALSGLYYEAIAKDNLKLRTS